MDVGGALGFVFEDEDWVTKILLGAALLLIPIFGIFVLLGYTIVVLRNVRAGEPRPLPAWADLGRFFVDGLMFWIASLIYALPLLVFLCPIAVVWLLPALGGEQEDLTALLAGVSGLLSVGLGCLAALYGILLSLLSPVLQIRYAETADVGACLRFDEIFRFLASNVGEIIVSQLLVWVAGMVVGSVVSMVVGLLAIIPICGWVLGPVLSLVMLPFGVWLKVFAAHLYGQISGRAGVAAPVV
jgi:hypothetical protein